MANFNKHFMCHNTIYITSIISLIFVSDLNYSFSHIQLNTKITEKVLFSGQQWGAYILVKQQNNNIIFALRGSMTDTLNKDTDYDLQLNQSVGGYYSGSWTTTNGVTGFLTIENSTLKITPIWKDLESGFWYMISAVMVANI